MMKSSYKVLILGGGAGGISVAARLKQTLPVDSLAIVEPSDKHYYQPFWTLAGAGVVSAESSEKNESTLIPEGIDWIKESVVSIDPSKNTVSLNRTKELTYDFLIVATGLKLN